MRQSTPRNSLRPFTGSNNARCAPNNQSALFWQGLVCVCGRTPRRTKFNPVMLLCTPGLCYLFLHAMQMPRLGFPRVSSHNVHVLPRRILDSAALRNLVTSTLARNPLSPFTRSNMTAVPQANSLVTCICRCTTRKKNTESLVT
jgi:hypothetical protein